MDCSNSINFRQDHFSSRMVSTLAEVGSFCHFFYKCCVTHSPYFSDLYLTSSQKILVVYVYPSLYVLTLNMIMIMRKSWPKPKKLVSYVFLMIIIVRFRVWCNICERPFSIILFGKKHTASPS